uniref:hypothetical protein n=1 Tax=Altererythrobacter segetis TaxID=1104773 RepID=UPI001407656B|nr:hypothetical protein [Altererythrobacter segetis]
MTLPRSLALLLPLVLLAGCNKPARNDERSASGEVLQGTVSDAMLPLDKLKSEPPLLAPSKAGTTPEGAEDEASGEGDAASEAAGEPGEAATAAPSPTAAP